MEIKHCNNSHSGILEFERSVACAPRSSHLGIRDAANFIGVSLRMFQKLRAKGYFRGFRVGNRLVFRLSELENDMENFREGAAR